MRLRHPEEANLSPICVILQDALLMLLITPLVLTACPSFSLIHASASCGVPSATT